MIRGGGDRAFVSGGDLKELAALRTLEEAAGMARRMRTICDRIAAFPAPVIAALNGHALGGGAEVAVAADIRVAADDVKIGFNQVSLAIMPAWGGAERLAALVGRSQALLLAGSGTVLIRGRGAPDRLDQPGGSPRGRSTMNGVRSQSLWPIGRRARSSRCSAERRPSRPSPRSPTCGCPTSTGRPPTR